MSHTIFSVASRQLLAIAKNEIHTNLPKSRLASSFPFLQQRSRLHSYTSGGLRVTQGTHKATKPSYSLLLKGAGIAGVGIGISSLQHRVHCDAPTPPPENINSDVPLPPSSSVSLYELSFGTVTGICAGVFIKKGAKAVAWFLGGIFVLLQTGQELGRDLRTYFIRLMLVDRREAPPSHRYGVGLLIS